MIVFDDVLASPISRYIVRFFKKCRSDKLDIHYLSQSYFDLLKIPIRNNSNKKILFNQTLKDIGKIYRDVGGYDLTDDEFKQKILVRGI